MPNRYGLTIRAADAADLDGLGALLDACGLPVPRERLAANLSALKAQPGALLIADAWGPPSGVIALHWTVGLTAELKTAEVTLLLVDPDHRRSGVARLLLKAASQAARVAGCGDLVLSSSRASDDLDAFALATGFTSAGRRLHRSLRKQG